MHQQLEREMRENTRLEEKQRNHDNKMEALEKEKRLLQQQLEEKLRQISRLEVKVDSQKKKIEYFENEKRPQQQKLNGHSQNDSSDTHCVPDIKIESETKGQKTNFHLQKKECRYYQT